ncbi:MAG: hypothetical protein DMF78_14235 [Acidobacteria bacterium]|nr:MAG: hypothetical protein DMF78_14235 [Acidobacteriota bacterium]
MRDRAAALLVAAAVSAALGACAAPPTGQSRGARPSATPPPAEEDLLVPPALRERVRADALRRARVWQAPAQPIAEADLAANPPGPGAFRAGEDVDCVFQLRPSEGWSPKFDCRLADGSVVKVKYGHNSVEVFAEVAATRLLSALGFGADRWYVVRSVIERKVAGRAIRGAHGSGWAWPELDRIDPAAGGSSRAEIDALRLMAVFLNDWDSKPSNQRLVCLPGGELPAGCSLPFAILQDVGETFGPRGVDLDGWRRTPVWADAGTCRVSMKDLPYQGATFGEARITEAGRRLLADELRQLSPAQVRALFVAARFADYARQSRAGRDVDNWVAAFEDRVRQIADRVPCPQ